MRTYDLIAIAWITMAVMSCHKDIVDSYETETVKTTDEIIAGIPKDTDTLTEADAAIVAKMFVEKHLVTKSESSKEIKNVITISDESGEPAIYAVNLNDGYIWVSATKKLCPILAVVEQGTFSIDDRDVGLEIIKEDYLNLIKQSEITDSVKRLWNKYELWQQAPIAFTKACSEYEDEIADLYSFAEEEGYKIYRLADAADQGMPDGIINGFVDIACDAYAGSSFDGGEYDYMTTAYVLERDFDETMQYGPYLKSSWSQGYPFNSSVPGGKPLGCVTIATAQYMHYRRLPKIYNTISNTYCSWSDMPNTTSNSTLETFLADLRCRLNIDDRGAGSVNDIAPMLNSKFGYNVKIRNFRVNDLNYPLRTGLIVILRGVNSDNEGHVWNCDGLRYNRYCGTEYNLYVLNRLKCPDFDYICIKTETDNIHTTTPYYHMNWGWGGKHDGWFLESNWNLGNENYTSERKMIY